MLIEFIISVTKRLASLRFSGISSGISSINMVVNSALLLHNPPRPMAWRRGHQTRATSPWLAGMQFMPSSTRGSATASCASWLKGYSCGCAGRVAPRYKPPAWLQPQAVILGAVQLHHRKALVNQCNKRQKFALQTVEVKVIRLRFEVNTTFTPSSSKVENKRPRIMASAISVTCISSRHRNAILWPPPEQE